MPFIYHTHICNSEIKLIKKKKGYTKNEQYLYTRLY